MEGEEDVPGSSVMAATMALVAASAPASVPGQGYIFLPFRGGVPFDVEIDVATIASANEHEAQILTMRGDLIVMVDSYASKPGENGTCTGGREVWVRLLDMAARRERSAILARSCRRGVTASDPLVTWDADGSGYTINLTSAAAVRVSAEQDG